MKKCFILLFLALIILPLVASAPPVTTTQQFSNGYVIKIPSIEYLQQNNPYEFEIHVYNISNGMPINAGIGCYFHLYNTTGNHINEGFDDSASHNFDYSFNLDGNNFSILGNYYYNVQCNSSTLGGYADNFIYVVPDKYQAPNFVVIFFIILFLFLIGSLLFLFIVGLAHSFNFEYDVIDLAWSWGIYFVMFGGYMFENMYIGNYQIDSIMPIILNVTGFTHILIPIISLAVSMLVGTLIKQKQNYGRIDKIQRGGFRYRYG